RSLLYYSIPFFTRTALPPIYTLSLHDALPISSLYKYSTDLSHCQRDDSLAFIRSPQAPNRQEGGSYPGPRTKTQGPYGVCARQRSEEHTSELQSRGHLVCRLLLEKKKMQKNS